MNYLATPRKSISTQSPTTYEVVMEVAGDVTVLGYTARTGRVGLMNVVSAHGTAVLAVCADEDAPVAIKGGGTRCTLHLGGNVVVKFSGRTERTAVVEG